jgi:hypothetical protein
MRLGIAFVAAFLGASFAVAADLPGVKAGLWESTVQQPGAPGKIPPTQMCLDASVLKEMMTSGMSMAKSMCTKTDSKVSGNKVYGEAECTFNGSKMKSKSVTTFNGDSSYRTETEATYDPPFMGRATSSAVIEAKWLGACPSGMQVGDVVGPGGMKMNMRALSNGK